MTAAQVLSLRLAMPRVIETSAGPLRTGLHKRDTPEPVLLQTTGLYGDGWADLEHHGLEDQAVCAFPLQNYEKLNQALGLELEAGAMGENAVVGGVDETTVHIGDQLRWGEALLEVTKARAPCGILNQAWDCSQLAAVMGREGLTGWYLRVLEPGVVEAGQQMELVERVAGAATVREQWMQK